MDRHTIEVGWEHEVPGDEVLQFRDIRSAELEGYYGTSIRNISDLEVAKYMVRLSFGSSRYLKVGLPDLVFSK